MPEKDIQQLAVQQGFEELAGMKGEKLRDAAARLLLRHWSCPDMSCR